MVKLLAFAGSIRQGSYNQKLLPIVVDAAKAAGAEVTVINLADFPMPIYNGDIEAKEGLPPYAKRLKELFKSHDGLLLSCPEYNGSIPPLLKNTIDWVSRKEAGDPVASVAYAGKTAGLVSASPGGLGGLRGLRHVRETLTILGMFVVPTQASVSKANDAFNSDGSLKDAQQKSTVEAVAKELVSATSKLKSH